MIDVCARILALEKKTPADTSWENLKKVEDIGAIASADKYIDMIRFRNFIVHRYEQIDPEILYRVVHEHLGDFEQFIDEMTRFLKQENELLQT